MTVLDEILDASTDSAVPVADLLRKVQIAATRLGATEIVEWTRHELQGYPDEADLPSYRRQQTAVTGHFTGPFQSWRHHPLTAVPSGMEDHWHVDFREPLTELQGLSEGDSDPTLGWASAVVQQYENARVFWIENMGLFNAWNVISRQSIRGMIDIVRTRAMEFALQLQTQFPDAGSVGGPTIASTPALAQTVYNITNYITGHGTNIAAGQGAQQTSTVSVGDETALLARLDELGLSVVDRNEYVAAIRDENAVDGPRVTGFLAKVRSGAIGLAAGLTTDVAAEVLVSLGRSFLGLPF